MCRVKDILRKTELEKNVKHKNNLVKVTRTSKANHYNNFFKENKLNILKTWIGIRKIIKIRPKKLIMSLRYSLIIPQLLTQNR